MTRRTSSWDALHCIRAAASGGGSAGIGKTAAGDGGSDASAAAPEYLRSEVLSILDAALHSERYTARPAYALALSAFKLQLLHDEQEPTARFVCMVNLPWCTLSLQ